MPDIYLHLGDCIEVMRGMPAGSVHCCVTSPPYWGLRDYGVSGQLGLEPTPDEYVGRMVEVFREVRRVLRDDGTLWLNLGDSYATGAGKAINPGGGDHSFPQPGVPGYRGRGAQVSNGRPQAGAPLSPIFQPNRMPIAGLKPKDLIGIPWRVALALQADGWYLRSDIIWHKPNPMPESVRDRPTKSHEYLFLLSKQEKYYFDAEAVREPVSQTPGAKAWRRIFDPAKQGKEASLKAAGTKGGNDGRRDPDPAGRNIRTVWTIATKPYKGAHFATFPPKLVEPCVKAGCPEGGTVFDPFAGSGTTGAVALQLGRSFVGIDLNQAYLDLARERIAKVEAIPA